MAITQVYHRLNFTTLVLVQVTALLGEAILFLRGLFLFFLFNSSRDLLLFLSFLLTKKNMNKQTIRMYCLKSLYKLHLQNAERRDKMKEELKDATLPMEITMNKRVQNCLKVIKITILLLMVGCAPDKLFTPNGEEYYIQKTCIRGHDEMILMYDANLNTSLPQFMWECDEYRIDTVFTGNKRTSPNL